MTRRLARPCLDCGRSTRNPSRCNQCAPAVKARTAARGYDGAWREVRTLVLQRDRYRCAWCGDRADTADHVVPLAHGGARLDPANLVAACRSCNSRRGATTRRARPVNATHHKGRSFSEKAQVVTLLQPDSQLHTATSPVIA